jgi:hypothetical protein
MKSRPYKLLLHPLFLTGLILLLLNDFYLKYEFHNGFTGKLSDFAGIFIFAVFLFVLFPAHKKRVIVFCSVFFCWWKSPLSGPFIHFVNDRLSIPLFRTIDYSDLFSLLILPLAYRVKPPDFSSSFIRSAAIPIVSIISLFSFCATTMPRQLMYQYYRENQIKFDEKYVTSIDENEILRRLGSEKYGFKKDSLRFYHIGTNGDFYYRIKHKNDSAEKWVPLTNNFDSTIFVRKEGAAFFIIPQYVLDGDTLFNLGLRIYSNQRKNKPVSIQFESFQTNHPSSYRDFYYGKLKKRYKKHFKELFRK